METLKGKIVSDGGVNIMNADAAPVPPSDKLLKELNQKLNDSWPEYNAAIAELTRLNSLRDACSGINKGKCRDMYSAKIIPQDIKVNQLTANIKSLQDGIAAEEEAFKKANDLYKAAIMAKGQSDPEVIKAQTAASVQLKELSNKKFIVIGVLIWVAIGLGVLAYYFIKKRGGK